jgi:chromate transporter
MTLLQFDWLSLLGHFLMLSLLAVGGALSTAPELHLRLVEHAGWLSDGEFNASIALAQAAPGPNVLFVALVGWHVGLNAAGGILQGLWPWFSALLGSLLAMSGMLLPSCGLTFVTARWGHHNRDKRGVRAFKQGMAPVVVALLVATGWIMAAGQTHQATRWQLWGATLLTVLIVWKTRLHLLWLLLGGGLAGAMGWI